MLRMCFAGAGVDRLGVYLYVQRLGQAGEVVRVAFLRPVVDERDARSSLTLMAQLAWERERSYVPVSPPELFLSGHAELPSIISIRTLGKFKIRSKFQLGHKLLHLVQGISQNHITRTRPRLLKTAYVGVSGPHVASGLRLIDLAYMRRGR